jgi:hypothetical protein
MNSKKSLINIQIKKYKIFEAEEILKILKIIDDLIIKLYREKNNRKLIIIKSDFHLLN